MRIALLANPRSGRGNGPEVAQELQALLEGAGHVVETQAEAGREEALAWFAERTRDCERLVVLGGDGTLSATLPHLGADAPPVAFRPLGTSNLVSHEIGLPRKLDDFARMIETGVEKPVDLGLMNGRRCFLAWDFGLGGELIRRMEEKRSGGTMRKSEYLPLALTMMREFRCPPQHVVADGTDLGEAELVIVAGMARFASRAIRLGPSIHDDGLWEMYLVRRAGFLAATRMGLAGLLGRVHRVGCVEFRRVHEVTVQGENPAPVQVDGDFAGTTPVEFSLSGETLRLLVPRE